MSLPELEVMIGQMVVADLRGVTFGESHRRFLESGLVSGFLMFPGDDAQPEQVRELTDAIRAISAPSPAILAIDQEGGRVQRLKASFTRIPCMRRLGVKADEKLAFEVGRIMGAELRAVGVNMDLAPVVDLELNPANQVIGDRALHSDPELVGRLGAALIKGLHSERIAACAKHFPGHGASSEDSHLELPTVRAGQQEIRERELLPFRKAMAAGVESVMVGHLLYPAFDKYHPASLSERLITGLLREEMGFEGVVIVDALEMKALEGIPLEDRAFMAARAGADIILVSEGLENAKRVHSALCQAVKMGVLAMDKIVRAYQRVTNFKAGLLKQGDLPPKSRLKTIIGSDAGKVLVAGILEPG